MASDLLGNKHNPTEVTDVLRTLRMDDKAYYDDEKKIRKVPVFVYDAESKPIRISHWQEREVADTLEEAQLTLKDYYKRGRGWIHQGKKPERDFNYEPTPVED